MITVIEYHDIERVPRKPKEAGSFCQKASNAGLAGLVRSKI